MFSSRRWWEPVPAIPVRWRRSSGSRSLRASELRNSTSPPSNPNKTIAVHGSWIHDLAVQQAFGLALSRGVDINLLVVDPKADGFKALEASALRVFEHPGLRNPPSSERIQGLFRRFPRSSQEIQEPLRALLFGFPLDSAHHLRSKEGHLRFFPVPETGNESIAYYSDDPSVVECLGRIFDQFKASSRAIASDEEYEALWNGLGVGAPRNGGSPHEGMASVPSGGLVTAR